MFIVIVGTVTRVIFNDFSTSGLYNLGWYDAFILITEECRRYESHSIVLVDFNEFHKSFEKCSILTPHITENLKPP